MFYLTSSNIIVWYFVLDWETEYGGYTSYIADGEDEEVSVGSMCHIII